MKNYTTYIFLVILVGLTSPWSPSLASTEASIEASTEAPTSTFDSESKNWADSSDFLAKKNPQQFKEYLIQANAIVTEFNAACANSFCVSNGLINKQKRNLKATHFECSVETTSEILGNCLIVITEFIPELNRKTGSLKTGNSRIVSCPLIVKGTLGQLMKVFDDALKNRNSLLNAVLPDLPDSNLTTQITKCLSR